MLCLIAVMSIYHQIGAVNTPKRKADFRERVQICEIIIEEADKQGVDSTLAVAVALEETRLTEGLKSNKGAIGPLQVLPKYWCDKRKYCDPIEAGVRALRYYVNHSPEYKDALRKYAGAGVRARKYSSRVMRTYSHLESMLDVL